MSDEKRTCSTCRFSKPLGGQNIECRRNVPTVIAGEVTALVHGGQQEFPQTVWPITRPGDWCGEWRETDESVAERNAELVERINAAAKATPILLVDDDHWETAVTESGGKMVTIRKADERTPPAPPPPRPNNREPAPRKTWRGMFR